MKKATWNGEVIAESDKTVNIEGNHYFPPESVNMDYMKKSDTHTTCHWKGTASYYTIDVNGKENEDAAWYYPDTSELGKNIKGYIAFWKGVEIE